MHCSNIKDNLPVSLLTGATFIQRYIRTSFHGEHTIVTWQSPLVDIVKSHDISASFINESTKPKNTKSPSGSARAIVFNEIVVALKRMKSCKSTSQSKSCSIPRLFNLNKKIESRGMCRSRRRWCCTNRPLRILVSHFSNKFKDPKREREGCLGTARTHDPINR